MSSAHNMHPIVVCLPKEKYKAAKSQRNQHVIWGKRGSFFIFQKKQQSES